MKIGIAVWARPTPQSGRGPDVLVDPEQVVRVVLGLDLRPAACIAEIGAGDPVLLFFRHEIDVDAAGRERFARLEQGPRPGDAGSSSAGSRHRVWILSTKLDIPVRISRRFRRIRG